MKKTENLILAGTLLVLLLFTLFTAGLFSSLDRFWHHMAPQRTEAVRMAIEKAAVQCYALEGSYPADIAYLAEHYGIQLDEDRYYYHYHAFASNILPEIKVLEKKHEE